MRILALLAALVLAAPAFAQTGGTPVGDLLRADGTLDAARAAGAGALDLSGFDVSMTDSGLRAVPQSAKAPGDWSAVGNVGTGFEDDVDALAVAPDGTLYAGGRFTSIDGTAAARIARYDGATWSEVGGGADNSVGALVVAPDGRLYAGGNFATVGGVAAGRVAVYTPGTDSWAPLGAGVSSGGGFPSVSALALGSDNTLHVVGSFDSAGGLATRSIARYDTGTGNWKVTGVGAGPRPGADGYVNGVALDEGNGVLYVTGGFGSVDGVTALNIAQVDLGTDTWSALGAGLDQAGQTVAVAPDGTLYAGGFFDSAGGVTARHVAAYDPGSEAWSALGTGIGVNGLYVTTLTIAADGTPYAATLYPNNKGVYAWNGSTWTADGIPESVNVVLADGTDLFAGTGDNIQSRDGGAWNVLATSIFDSYITSAVYAADGTLTVGGDFTATPNGRARGLASFDGTVWSEVGGGIRGDMSVVSSLAYDDAGHLLVAGRFDQAGSVPADNLAIWDGTAWTPVGGGADDTVYSLQQLADGSYLATGQFTTIGGVAAAGIARWNGTTWAPMGSGMNSNVVTALEASDGSIYAAGEFTMAGGVPATGVARWDGSAWSALGSGLSSGPPINAGLGFDLLELPDGRIVVGGLFDDAGGVAVVNVAAWDGSAWSALGDGTGVGDVGEVRYVLDVYTSPDGALYAAGTFSDVGGTPASGIARLDPVTGTWAPLDSDLGGTAFLVYELATTPLGRLLAIGSFAEAGGVTASNIASLELDIQATLPDAEGWSALGTGTNGVVSTVAVAPDGSIYAGGSLTMAGGVSANRIARWDGASWAPLGSGMNNVVRDIVIAPDGTLYATGAFSAADGASALRIASWDGTAWSPLGSGLNGGGRSLALAPDGTLYVGGGFSSAGGVPAANIAAWDGAAWSALGAGIGDDVDAIAVGLDGVVYAGGEFTTAGGSPNPNFAAWDGATWSDLGASFGSPVYDLAVGGDGVLYVAGDFSSAAGTPASFVATWNGTAWGTLGAGLGDPAQSILIDPLGTVYVGGDFTTAGGSPASRIAKWNGSAWSALGSGTNGSVRALAHDRVSGLVAGGFFNTAGGLSTGSVARWQTPLSLTLAGAAGWRMLSAPAFNVSWADVLEPIWTQGMTGSDNPDADPVTFCNVFQHDETVRTDTNNDGVVSTADGWSCVPSLGAAQPGESVLVYVFADDDNDGTADAFPKVLPIAGGPAAALAALPFTVSGVSFTDSPILPRIQEGFNYVGNPTPLALDLDLFQTTGLRATAYVWDPTLFGGDYRTWNGAAGELSDGILSPGQAFFLQADTPSPSVTIPAEATRTAGRPLYGKTGDAAPTVRFELARRAGGELFPEASAFVSLDARAGPDLDRFDGLRLGTLRWPFASLYTLVPGGDTPLVVNALAGEPEVLDLPLGIQSGGYADGLGFALTWDGLALADGWRAELLDTETGTTTSLDTPGRYDFELSGTEEARAAPATLAARPAPLTRAPTGERFVLRITGNPLSSEDAPDVFAVGAPFPNPARGAVSLPLALPNAGPVRIVVYDLLGRQVAIVADGDMPAGQQTARLETRDLAAGVYVVRVTAGDAEATRRISVIR